MHHTLWIRSIWILILWGSLHTPIWCQITQPEGRPEVLDWIEEAENNISYQDDSAFYYLQKVDQYLQHKTDSALLHRYYYDKSRTLLSDGQAPEAFNSIRLAIEVITPMRDTASLALYIKQKAKVLFFLQDYTQAMQFTIYSDSLYNCLRPPFANWENAKIRADIHRTYQQFEEAEKDLEVSLARAKTYDSRMNVGFILWHKIQLFIEEKDIEKQAQAIQDYLDFTGENQIGSRVKPFHVGSLFEGDSPYETIARLEKLLPIYERDHNFPAMQIMLENLTQLYINTYQYNKASAAAQKGLELTSKFYLGRSEFLYQLYTIHKQAGHPTLALSYLEQWKQLDDSVLQVESRNKIQELQVRYQTAQKEQEIYQLVTQNQIKDLTIQKARRNYGLLGIGLLSAILLSSSLYAANRYRKQTAQKLASANAELANSLDQRELLLKEIHHRVKNNLQVISSLLYLQSQHTSDRHAIQALNEGRNRVQSMGLIHQNLYQDGHLTGVNIKTYIEKLVASLMESYQIHPDRISWSAQLPDKNIRIDTMIPFALIINELISNAIKHGFPNGRSGHIAVEITENTPRGWTLAISDDGVGLPKDFDPSAGDSLGLELVRMFCKRIGARLSFANTHGTTVTLSLPNLDLL